ncbi:MAG: flavin monoamine oxidase family protein [Candidatus Tectimicrobiota bacterium]
MPQDTTHAQGVDIAIVGGGIAGLYCCLQLAHRFQRQGEITVQGQPVRSIALYEASGRLGGRIETWRIPLRPGETGLASSPDPRAECVLAEFGPMRIEPRDQPLLQALLDYLGIREPESHDEAESDLIPFPAYAAEEPAEPRFTLTGEEGDQHSLLDLFLLAIRRICELIKEEAPDVEWNPEASVYWRQFLGSGSVRRRYWKGEMRDWILNLTDADYDRLRQLKVNDVYLWDMGFWNLLSEVLSHLAVIRIRDWASYYHVLPENPNAAEWLIFWLRALKSTNALRGIRGGMSLIIERLASKLEALHSAGVPVSLHYHHKLTGLQARGGAVELGFDGQATVLARRVILALPRLPLSQLGGLPGPVQERLNTVLPLPLLKAFFLIDQPWWEDERPANRFAGDLPTRELHYGKSKKKTKGLIMVYTDRPATQFWTEYLTEDARVQRGQDYAYQRIRLQHEAKLWHLPHSRISSEYDTPNPRLWRRFVQYARDYEHHDFTCDRLLACGIRDWGKEPYGGAAHAWRPGEKSWEVMQYFTAFALEEGSGCNNVHICGEAYSDYQGFIEGALRSAARVLAYCDTPLSTTLNMPEFLRQWTLPGSQG